MRKIVLIFTMLVQLVFAQSNTVADQDQYLKSLQARVAKIVAPLGIEKEKQSQKVHALVLSQYQTLSRIHGERDAKTKALRSTSAASKEEMKSLEAAVEMDANKEITKMHDLFLHRLGRRLKAEQVDADGAYLVQRGILAFLLGQHPRRLVIDVFVGKVSQAHDFAQRLAVVALFIALCDDLAAAGEFAHQLRHAAILQLLCRRQLAIEFLAEETGGAAGDVDVLADQVAVHLGHEIVEAEV